MFAFKKVKLREVVNKIIGGGTPSKSNSSYWNGTIPWASVKDLSDNKYYLDCTEDSITETGLKNSSSNLINKDTVILPTRMGLGRVVITRINTAINQDLKAIIPNEKIINDFLLWALIFSGKKLQTIGNGSTVSGIRLEDLKNIEIDLPDIPSQTRIASTLSAYDNLIENNEKRIKALEEMAQLLYTEWFVKFNFPSHEKVKMVDSGTNFGLIPREWKVKKLGDFINVRGGLSYKNEFLTKDDSELPLITMGCIHSRSLFNFSGLGYYSGEYGENHILKGGDLVMATRDVTSERKILGSPAIVPNIYRKAIAATNVYMVSNLGEDLNNPFLYLLFRSPSFRARMIGHATGTNILMIVKGSVLGFSFVFPEKSLLSKFSDIINPIFTEMEKLEVVNQNSSKIRDLLIPQLVTGKREVKN